MLSPIQNLAAASPATPAASREKQPPTPSPPPSLGGDHYQKWVELKPGMMAILPMSTLDPQQYAFVVNRIDANLQTEKRLQNTSLPAEKYLRPGYESIFLAQPTPEAKGTILMFHGYTAGPWQFKELAERFYQEGYNVYVPRLPGHGFMDAKGEATGEDIIRLGDNQEYERYINSKFVEAAALGSPVSVIGLSGGGNIALRMAEKFPNEIKRGVAMAPFLGPNSGAGLALKAFRTLNQGTFGAFGYALGFLSLGKNQTTAPDDPVTQKQPFPHTQGSASQARGMFHVGASVKQVSVPFQFFTTEGDHLSGNEPVGDLFTRSGGKTTHGWYHFSAEDKVPHAMASPKQNTEPGRSEALHQMIVDNITQGTAIQRHRQEESNFGSTVLSAAPPWQR